MFDQAAEDMAGTGFTNMCPVASVAAEVAETVDELRDVTAGVFIGWLADGTAYLVGRGLPEPERIGPLEGVVAAPREFISLTSTSVAALGRFFTPGGISDFASQVSGARDDRAAVVEEQREAAAPVTDNTSRVVDQSEAAPSGENRLLSIWGLVSIGSDLAEVDPGALVVLFAMINVFIGVFNLLPLLPFDGGHVAIAVYERIQELRLGRRRYLADVGRLIPFTYAVVLLMGMLFVSTIYLDIANPMVAR